VEEEEEEVVEEEEEEEDEKEEGGGGGWETQEARRKRRNADFQKSFTEFQEKHFQLQLGDDEDWDTIFQDLEKMVKQKTNPNNKRGLKRMGETHKTKPRKAGKVAVEDCYVMSARDETLLDARGFYLHEKTNIYQRDSWGIDPKTRERGSKPSIKRECYNTLSDAFKRMDEIKKMWEAGELNKKHYGNPDDWSIHYGRKRGGRFELRKTCECKNSPPSKMNLMTRVFLPIGRTPEMKEDSWKKDNTQKKSAEVVVESEEEEDEPTLPGGKKREEARRRRRREEAEEEEEESDGIAVEEWEYKGKTYLVDDDEVVYNMKNSKKIGKREYNRLIFDKN